MEEREIAEQVEQMSKMHSMIEAAKNGDEFAESEIHIAFVKRLVGLSNRYISEKYRSKVDPEDVVQSVFKSFFLRNRDDQFFIDGVNDLWLLLARITVSKTINRINQYRTNKRDIGLEAQKDNNVGSTYYGAGDQPTAFESLVFTELLDEIFKRLPENLQRIVCLRLQGYTNFEISEIEKCSTRTVIRSMNKIRNAFESIE